MTYSKWVLVWCAGEHLESFRVELLDWFREEGEGEWEEETPEQELDGVKILISTRTGKGKGCLVLACKEIPEGMRATLKRDEDILDYLIRDAIAA